MSSSRDPDPSRNASAAAVDRPPEPQDPVIPAAPATATAAAPKLDVREVRNRWPSIVKEITAQRSGLGSFMAEAGVSACTPADDDR